MSDHPSLRDRRFFSTVRLDGDATRASSFLVAHPTDDADGDRLFLATARHALENTESLSLRFLAANEDGSPNLGVLHIVEIVDIAGQWVGHPDETIDLAVIAVDELIEQIGAPTTLEPIETRRFHDAASMDELPAIAAVTFLGYPSGISDPRHTTPVARRGYSATPPVLDYAGQPQFLIDAAVFPGSSGSPVFSEDVAGSGQDLLGIVVKAKAGPSLDQASHDGRHLEMLDLGVVYKASALLELVESAAAS